MNRPDVIYTLKEIASAMQGRMVAGNSQAPVRYLLTDSRNFRYRDDTLFIAVSGDHHDGNNFVKDLYEKGLRNFAISDSKLLPDISEANVILVHDGLQALQALAREHRRRYTYPVMTITGSNGKTIVKEWLFQLLRRQFHVVRSPRSYNSQIGVPLSVWQMGPSHNLALFEAGISRPGEMETLQDILLPTWGLITNIGSAHQENFESLQSKIDEKVKLFMNCNTIFYCRDHSAIHDTLTKQYASDPKKRLISWSEQAGSELVIEQSLFTQGETELRGSYKNQKVAVKIPFTHKAAIENACHCWLVLLWLGIPEIEIQERMLGLAPVAMRLELIEGVHGCTIVNDSYNSDILSLEIALDYLRQQGKNRTKTLIVSDIAQTGLEAEKLYNSMAELVRAMKIDKLIGIGPEISKLQTVFENTAAQFYASTEAFIEQCHPGNFRQEDILIKGARTFGLERIAELLSEKSHETVMEINLGHLRENLHIVKRLLKPGTRIMAMVKAFSYGGGSYEIARLLEHARVDYLAVAYADEGIALRKAGIELPILVLNPEASAYTSMIWHQLEPQIFSFKSLSEFIAALRAVNPEGLYPIHIKINTGMNRLGFDSRDLSELRGKLSEHQELVEVISVFTHLTGSENRDMDEVTTRQYEKFTAAADALESVMARRPMRHLLNSGGIIRHPQLQSDMVRIGIALHGVNPATDSDMPLKPVSRLLSTISQIRTVPAGEGVGYNPHRFFVAARTIAILPIGYADGFSRSLGNGNWKVWIQGSLAPTVGNICMDMCMVDVTGIPCKEGDQVELFGENLSVNDMAAAMNTIAYEVLSCISQRVKRLYIQE